MVGNYDVAPDGKRILGLLPAGQEQETSRTHVVLYLNFFDEVRRRTQPQ